MSGHIDVIAKVAAESVLHECMRVAAFHMPPTVFDSLDAWIADPPDPKPTRREAIREAPADHLKAKGCPK